MTGIDRVVREVGGQSELARQLQIKPQSVQQWVRQKYVPAARCQAVADLVNGRVSLHDLNPQVFPRTA